MSQDALTDTLLMLWQQNNCTGSVPGTGKAGCHHPHIVNAVTTLQYNMEVACCKHSSHVTSQYLMYSVASDGSSSLAWRQVPAYHPLLLALFTHRQLPYTYVQAKMPVCFHCG